MKTVGTGKKMKMKRNQGKEKGNGETADQRNPRELFV
jgi:hypothetical protein